MCPQVFCCLHPSRTQKLRGPRPGHYTGTHPTPRKQRPRQTTSVTPRSNTPSRNTTSAARQAYYAGRGNKFWTILAQTGLTPRRLQPEEYRRVLDYGIGLTDVVKNQSGSDRGLCAEWEGAPWLRERLHPLAPRWIAFNGKTAARWTLHRPQVSYGEQPDRWGDARLVVLPSTSGAARGWWDESWWHEAAARIRDEETNRVL